MNLEWGYDRNITNPEIEAAWGARAIWSEDRDFIDLLADRQDMQGPEEGRKVLAAWLNAQGLKEIHRKIRDRRLTQSSMELVLQDTRFRGRKFTIFASPNASYGYLYLTAYLWKEDAPPDRS